MNAQTQVADLREDPTIVLVTARNEGVSNSDPCGPDVTDCNPDWCSPDDTGN